MPDNTLSTLDNIRVKVRRLTRSPTTSQLSDADIDQYVNTFVLYDFPSQLRLFNLRRTLTWYTQPGVDTYTTVNLPVTDPLYNFKNQYIAIHPPVFMAGIQCSYTQWRDVFYGWYPQTNTIADTLLRGNGTPGPFAGTVTAHPMLQNNVIFTCVDANGTSMILTDTPFSNVSGYLSIAGRPGTAVLNNGTVNYLTGAFNITNFPANTLNGAIIYVEDIAYQPGKPLAMLYYNDTFTIRPVPDKTYAVQIEVDVRPSEMMSTTPTQMPELSQWYQLYALGAAIKIFQDRFDFDSVQMLMPEFNQQMRLALRTTLTQQANERTVTIYTMGRQYGLGGFWSGWPY